MSRLIRIIYSSAATTPFGHDELLTLLGKSLIKNADL